MLERLVSIYGRKCLTLQGTESSLYIRKNNQNHKLKLLCQEPPWDKFAVGKPSLRKYRDNADCQPFSEIHHVAHIKQALRIIEDGVLRANLVYDKSKLNKHRIRVVWLSPNNWEHKGGFRYGNVKFTFSWKSLIKGCSFYWVESIRYKPEACRILITKREYDSPLEPYDPRLDTGPWWYDEDKDVHYWNGNYCLEFMIDKDMMLSILKRISFVTHHPYQCSIDPEACPDLGLSARKASFRIISSLVSNGVDPSIRRLFFDEQEELSQDVRDALRNVLRESNKKATGELDAIDDKNPAAEDVARAILMRTSIGDENGVRRLCGLFADPESLELSTIRVFAKEFGLAPETLHSLKD